jgi:hypothetical protein
MVRTAVPQILYKYAGSDRDALDSTSPRHVPLSFRFGCRVGSQRRQDERTQRPLPSARPPAALSLSSPLAGFTALLCAYSSLSTILSLLFL